MIYIMHGIVNRRANNNNGITTRVDKIMGVEPYEAGNMTLSLGGEYLGSCFIQPDVFYTSQNVVVLVPKWDMSFEVKPRRVGVSPESRIKNHTSCIRGNTKQSLMKIHGTECK